MSHSPLPPRALAVLLLVLVFASGCAGTQNTLAQDVAWERWQKCKDVQTGVELKEIRPDGQIWILHRTGGELQAVRECLSKAVSGTVVAALVTEAAPLTPDQRARAVAAQRLADRIAELYGVSSVNVLVGPLELGQGASIRGNGVMTLSPEILDFPEMIRDAYLAHEMGHWILGHGAGAAVSVSEQQQREIAADIKAVEILMRSKSMPEVRAFAAIYAQQMSSKQTLDEGKTVPLASHPDPCRKMAALLAAYPAEQAFVDRLKQNPKAPVCRP